MFPDSYQWSLLTKDLYSPSLKFTDVDERFIKLESIPFEVSITMWFHSTEKIVDILKVNYNTEEYFHLVRPLFLERFLNDDTEVKCRWKCWKAVQSLIRRLENEDRSAADKFFSFKQH